jgi:transcriptional regulator with XRE-family HTH domain
MNTKEFLDCSITTLEQLTGIGKAQWSHYFHGRRSMSLRTLCRLAEQLEMTPETMLNAMLTRIDNQAKASR